MSQLLQAARPITGLLAATDLQDGSDVVLEAAASIARMADARLHGIYVLQPAGVARALRARALDTADHVLEQARRGLWSQMARLQAEGTEVASVVVTRGRSIHKGILDIARAAGVDLLVMGSHAHPSAGMRLGSTADRVVRTSPVPCLVVRGEPRFPVHRAAVLTDFSPAARAGLCLALSWLPGLGLSDPNGRLDVIHCAWPEVPGDGNGRPVWMEEGLEKEIAAAAALVPEPPHTIRPRVLFSAYPAEATIAEAREQDYQLIVVATHGGGALSRALIGSVTLGLMHASPCPVLVIPRARRGR